MYSVKFTPTKKRSACPHRRPFHVHIRQNGRFLSAVFSKYGFIRAFLSSAVMCFPSFAAYGNMFLNLLRLRASCAAALLVSFGKNNRAASLGYPVVYIRFSSRFDECAHRTAFTAKSG